MSRLTAPPNFQTNLTRRNGPISPPETDYDFAGPSMKYAPDDMDSQSQAAAPVPQETPSSRFRRVSTLAYNNSNLREARDRTVQRSSKSLVVVVPPAAFSQEHGQLGHTLTTGPRGRLSNGVLLPLFPTMYGQLTAIAREFAFPSVTGICIYVQTEHGAPRVSDDIWQLLWAHLFDARSPASPSTGGLPIHGRIEFDIDLHKARWYPSWISSSTRDSPVDLSMYVSPSRAPSVSHYRAESRDTFAAEENIDDGASSIVPINTARPRHVPRKLSLVSRTERDRFETFSIKSGSRAHSRAGALSPPAQQKHHALSPIVQQEEPQTAKKDLDHRVKSWRASAVLTPTPLAAMGQPSLDPANMPNTVSLDNKIVPAAEEEEVDAVLNLEDFTWSISSAGPPEYNLEDLDSPVPWNRHNFSRLPSPDIGRRMVEDCPPTPSTATSWGAPLSWPPSPAVVSRAESVDLGAREIYSRPCTPSTATSWGPASPPMSPFSQWVEFRTSSPDLGERALCSRPCTPSTATSWGPSSGPSSPMVQYAEYRSSSPDLGQRGLHDAPATPSTATSWGPSSWPASPATPYHVDTPDLGQRTFDEENIRPVAARPWHGVWPYTLREEEATEAVEPTPVSRVAPTIEAAPWKQVWPYRATEAGPSSAALVSQAIVVTEAAPWKQVWPYRSPREETLPAPAAVPEAAPWKQVWPYRASTSGDVKRSTSVVERPSSTLRPIQVRSIAAYPHMEIYAGHPIAPFSSKDITTRFPAVYPNICLYAPAYPALEIYPAYLKSTARSGFSIKATVAYPSFEIFAGYIVSPVSSQDIITRLPAVYPDICAYESVYPHIQVYRPVAKPTMAPSKMVGNRAVYPVFEIFAGYTIVPASSKVIITRLSIAYHNIYDIYESVYPSQNIYPSVGGPAAWNATIKQSMSTRLQSSYPAISLYAPVYPFLEIYPANPVRTSSSRASRSVTTKLPSTSAAGPCRIYAPVYPYNLVEIYPAVATAKKSVRLSLPTISTGTKFVYPFICVYAPETVYPVFNISGGVRLTPEAAVPSVFTKLPSSSRYPVLQIYAPVYPHCFQIYGSQSVPKTVTTTTRPYLTTSLPSFYPTLRIYKRVYPHNLEEVYPQVACSPHQTVTPVVNNKLAPRYPVLQIYSPVYPVLKIYGSVRLPQPPKTVSLAPITTRLSSSYPNLQIYERVYPFQNIYPSVGRPAAQNATITQAISTRLQSGYPAIVLYDATYPFFDLYPGVAGATRETQVNALRVVVSVLKTAKILITHAQLHQAVFPSGLVSTPSGTPRAPKVSASHQKLHDAVFPGEVSSPSGTFKKRSLDDVFPLRDDLVSGASAPSFPPPSPRRASIARGLPSAPAPMGGRSRSGTITMRPVPAPVAIEIQTPSRSSSRLSSISSASPSPSGYLRPSPTPTGPRTHGLPVSPSPRSTSINGSPTLRRPMSFAHPPAPPPRSGLPETPREAADAFRSSAQRVDRAPPPLGRTPSVAVPSSRTGEHPSAARRGQMERAPPTLGRAASITSRTDRNEHPPVVGQGLDRTKSMSATGHVRRDSLVLQRVKAYNTTSGASDLDKSGGRITMQDLSHFPSPPRPSLPSGPAPSKLDRNRYPFHG